jgi:hypothetical protein
MMKRETDMYTLDLIANLHDREYDVSISHLMTLASLTDMIGGIIEATPHATSFVITIARRVTHTEEDLVN